MLLSRAQAIPFIEIKAVMLKEWFDTERGKKADVLEKATLFPRKKVLFVPQSGGFIVGFHSL